MLFVAPLICHKSFVVVFISLFYSPANADTILHKLQKHKFPEHKWINLATGLKLASRVPGIKSENSDNLSRLIALVNHWTANYDEGSRWKTLVDAVNMCGEYIVARNLAQDVGVPAPQ